MENPVRKPGSFFFLFLLSFISSLAFAQSNVSKRMALVIGVKSYQYVQPLQNSLNDARDLSATLKAKGFQVVELYDPKTKREMLDGIRKYFALLGTDKNAAGLMFYSGHGMQVDGSNYLIPTQADPQIKADLDDQCVNMDYVMRAIEEAGNGLNIFVLDACRNNPFRSFSRSAEKGLSMVNTPKGSYIVYSTKPGSVASDGTGRNGLFTSKLLKYINADGLNIEQVFKRVAADVATESNDAQRPWIASDYTGDFYFTPGSTGLGDPMTLATPVIQKESNAESKQPETSSTENFDFGYGVRNTKVVVVGDQQWISQNLNVDHFANGDPITMVRTKEEWKLAGEKKIPAWCYYNNDPSNGDTYGKLYNWYAVHDPRSLAPKGWHVPNETDWNMLIDYLGGEGTAGNKMKSTTLWNATGNGNDSNGITGLPGGFRESNGAFVYLGMYCTWWSSTEIATGKAFNRILGYNFGFVHKKKESMGSGFYVRCVKD